MTDFDKENWRIEECPCGHPICKDFHILPYGPRLQGDGVDADHARLIKAAPKLYLALQAAQEHLDYTGYGDSWERECATEQGLPAIIETALAIVDGTDPETEAQLKGEPNATQT